MNAEIPGGAGVGLRAILAATSGFRFRSLVALDVKRARTPGVLEPPYAVYVDEDGRALAWFGKARPCVVHPSFPDLCRMHGVEAVASLAA